MAAALGRMLRSSLAAGTKLAPACSHARFMQAQAPLLSTRRMFSTRVSAKAAAAPELDEDEVFDEDFAPESAFVQRRVLKLKEVQEAYDAVSREYQKELALLQAKYYDKYSPLFDQRREVVLGKTPVDKYDIEDDGEPDAGIPGFWLGAFMNNEKVGAYITQRDAQVLEHLVDVRAKVLTGEDRGFELTFMFADNPHLVSKTLTKTYLLEPEDDVIPKKFVGCDIEWKDEKSNPTVEQRKKRVKSKEAGKGGKPAFVVESVPVESFFNFFDPPEVPEDPENLGDEELEALQEELSADFDIGFAIKDQIIPRAVEWYTGELADPYDEDDGEGFEDEEFEPEEEPVRRR